MGVDAPLSTWRARRTDRRITGWRAGFAVRSDAGPSSRARGVARAPALAGCSGLGCGLGDLVVALRRSGRMRRVLRAWGDTWRTPRPAALASEMRSVGFGDVEGVTAHALRGRARSTWHGAARFPSSGTTSPEASARRRRRSGPPSSGLGERWRFFFMHPVLLPGRGLHGGIALGEPDLEPGHAAAAAESVIQARRLSSPRWPLASETSADWTLDHPAIRSKNDGLCHPALPSARPVESIPADHLRATGG